MNQNHLEHRNSKHPFALFHISQMRIWLTQLILNQWMPRQILFNNPLIHNLNQQFPDQHKLKEQNYQGHFRVHHSKQKQLYKISSWGISWTNIWISWMGITSFLSSQNSIIGDRVQSPSPSRKSSIKTRSTSQCPDSRSYPGWIANTQLIVASRS